MAGANTLEFTDDNFEAEVLEAGQPVLVDFWAEWCGPCKALGPVIDELANDFKGRVKVGKVNTDANRDITVQYGISNIPTVLVFQSGEIRERFVGLRDKRSFTQFLNGLLDSD